MGARRTARGSGPKPGRPRSVFVDIVHFPVTALGPGVRVGLWFRGCTIRCEGCIASHAWEFSPECKTNVRTVLAAVADGLGRGAEGVSISGGEPFDQPEALYDILTGLRSAGADDVLVYSGYALGDIRKKFPRHLELIDVIVDGRFVPGLESDIAIAGSGNQTMTVLSREPKIAARYGAYFRQKDMKRELQIIESNGRLFLVGVPRQRDVEAIKKIIG